MIPLRLHFLSAVKTIGGEDGRYLPIFRDFPKLLSNFQIKDFGWDECNCGHSLWNASRHVLIWAYNMACFPVYIFKQWSPEARSIIVRLWSSSSYNTSIVWFLQIICFCRTEIPCSCWSCLWWQGKWSLQEVFWETSSSSPRCMQHVFWYRPTR